MNETGPAEIHQASTGVHNVKFHIRIPLLTKDAFLDPGLGLLAIDMPKYNVISSDLNPSSLAEEDVPRQIEPQTIFQVSACHFLQCFLYVLLVGSSREAP